MRKLFIPIILAAILSTMFATTVTWHEDYLKLPNNDLQGEYHVMTRTPDKY